MAITDIKLSGYIFQDDGDAVNGATVAILETGTTTQEDSTTTNSDGLWTFTETSLDTTYDVKVTSGSSVRKMMWADEIALKGVDTSYLKIRGANNAAAPLYFFADRGDENIDVWRINAANGGDLTFDNRASGSSDSVLTAQLTIRPNATAASSVVAVAGNLTVGGDLTISGDDLTMGTNTSTAILVADGTNYNPVVPSGVIDLANNGAFTLDNTVISSQTELTSGLAAADELLYSDGGTVKKVGLDTLTTYLAGVNAGTVTSTGLSDSSGVITLDIQNMTASTTIADADLVVIDDGAGGTLRKMTRANFIESAALDAVNIDGGAIDGTIIGANSAAAGTFTAIVGTTIDASTDFTIGDTVITDGVITDSTGLQLAANLDIDGTADISGDLTLSGGADGALQFTNAGENSIKIPDNQASALIIEQADNAYITFVTTNSSEAITVAKATTFSAGIANSGTIAAGTWNGTAIASGYIAADAITGAKIADDAIDSEHYTDGSIDTAHLAADAVTGAKIADDAIDSEHYANGSIDTAHIADDQVTLAKMAGLARGKLIYGDSSGNPTALAVGSANQVLTHDGTDLAWADASGSGAVSAVANGADNRIATFSSSTALNGEANLTFSGSALALSGTFAVGANTDGYDVQFFGNADGAYMLWDESADDLVLAGAARLGVGQAPEYPFQVHTSQSGDWLVDLDNTHTNPYGLRIKHSGASNNNTTNIFVQAGDASASRFFVYSNGDVANTGGTYGTISDESLKQDITSARSYWSDFKNLQVRKFRFRTDVAADSNAPYRLGFVAQEAETVFPSLVQSNQSPDESSATKWVKSSIIQGPIMVKVVQELIARVEALES